MKSGESDWGTAKKRKRKEIERTYEDKRKVRGKGLGKRVRR